MLKKNVWIWSLFSLSFSVVGCGQGDPFVAETETKVTPTPTTSSTVPDKPPGCTEGQFECQGNRLNKCEKGVFVLSDSCKNNRLCDAVAGQCLKCESGQAVGCVANSNNLQEICQPDGFSVEPQACTGATPFCVNEGECVQCIVPTDCPQAPTCMQPLCVQNKCEVGPADAGEVCGTNQVCNGQGACGDCKPNDLRCSKNKVEQCDAVGQWQPKEDCNEKGLFCGAGSCSGADSLTLGVAHSCFLLKNGSLFCWGDNSKGTVGIGNEIAIAANPVELKELEPVESVSVSHVHSCATKQGEVWCWGDNFTKQLGVQEPEQIFTPNKVEGIIDATQVAVAALTSCIVRQNKTVQCWGSNYQGLLGQGKTQLELKESSTPLAIEGLENVEVLTTGVDRACALVGTLPTSELYCWGSGKNNMFEDNDLSDHAVTTPQKINAIGTRLIDRVEINKGFVFDNAEVHGSFVQNDIMCVREVVDKPMNGMSQISYQTWCWGKGFLFGDEDLHPTPVLMGTGDEGLRLEIGSEHACNIQPTISSNGFKQNILNCLGNNEQGQIGVELPNQNTSVSTWTEVVPNFATYFESGNYHNCAIIQKNLMCWGNNNLGQLGTGKTQLVIEYGPQQVVWK
jgi:alpha-tubulin suppressor-like RCC1 family protein